MVTRTVDPAQAMEPEPEADAGGGAAKCLPVGGAAAAPADAAATPSPAKEGSAKKKKKNRCLICKKKVGLTGFSCQCGGLFCGAHRMATAHSCQFDHAGRNRQLLDDKVMSTLPSSDKFEKI